MTARIRPTNHISDRDAPIEDAGKASTDARSTNGDEIRNEKVTPIGRPALVNR
jgi:hypothetical protein